MSWTQDNALKRIFNVFKRSKDKVYKEDIEALKLLSEEIEARRMIIGQDNLLFAKLLCYILNAKLHDKGNMKSAIIMVSKVLKEPLNHQIELLRVNINSQELNVYLSSIGIDNNFPLHDSDKNLDILNKSDKEIIDKIQKNWDFKTVQSSFLKTANEFLTETENYI
jgi:hypothetical protein